MLTTAMLGVVGGAIPEMMRIIATLRLGKSPTRHELLASLLAAMLGLGVLLFDTDGENRLQIAVLGAAFPQLFSSLLAAAKPPADEVVRGPDMPLRSVFDYLAWRL